MEIKERKIKDLRENMFVAADEEGMMCHTSLAHSEDTCKQFISSVKQTKWDVLSKRGYTIEPVFASPLLNKIDKP